MEITENTRSPYQWDQRQDHDPERRQDEAGLAEHARQPADQQTADRARRRHDREAQAGGGVVEADPDQIGDEMILRG